MFALHKNKITQKITLGYSFYTCNRFGRWLQNSLRFLHSLKKTVESDWFKQVINHIKFITLQRILRVSGGLYYFGFAISYFQKLNPRKFRHLHIQKNQVDIAFLYQS